MTFRLKGTKMKALEKLGRSSLAILLAGFVCLCPPNLTAFAEEAPDAGTSHEATQSESTQTAQQVVDENAPIADAVSDDISEANAKAAEDAETADEATAEETEAVADADNTNFDVASTEDFVNAVSKARAASVSDFTINVTSSFNLTGQASGSNTLMPSSGQTITIVGNGHTISYDADAGANTGIGSAGGVLNLGNPSGSDSLTITANGGNAGSSLVQVLNGGTVNMYSGVVLADQVGGSTYGGGVYVKSGTFNMYGGTITGCNAVSGGGVYIASGSMTMSGNATITDCSTKSMGNANSSGGGVFVGPSGTFTMEGNATITDCSSSSKFGGGVDVERRASFTMSGDASISGNSAVRGGGVLNLGTFNGGKVYNNSASDSGADVYNRGTMTLASIAGHSYVLASDGHTIDGWYYDGYYKGKDSAGKTVLESSRWNADTTSDSSYMREYVPNGETTEITALKAAYAVVPEEPAAETDDTKDNTDDQSLTGDETGNTTTGAVTGDTESGATDTGETEAEQASNIPSSFDVANTEEFKAAMDQIKSGNGGSYTINITDDFELSGKTREQDHLMPEPGQTITIVGNGHTIAYQTNTSSQLALGAKGGTLNLGKPDGTDSLTITLHATDTDDPLILVFMDGTVNMYDGVTLTGNVNRTGLGGGAVDIQTGTFNMYGGVISDCYSTVVTYGGAVCLQGGTFNMSGGTITGCHEEYNHGRHGFGGAVAVGMTGKADQFNMSGNAVIENCKAEYGGGVYINSGSMKMSDNAVIRNCEAEVVNGSGGLGGGVYVNAGATFDMSGNATITANSATDGGGIISWGTVTATTVHNNIASNSGDDIYNAGTITLASAKNRNWVLNSDNVVIDGWYYDGHHETGTTDEQGSAVVEKTRWNVSAASATDPNEGTPEPSGSISFRSLSLMPEPAYADELPDQSTADDETKPAYAVEFTNTGNPTNEIMALKAAHSATTQEEDVNVYWDDDNGTVLYELDDVAEDAVPAAGAYNTLTGKDNPTKASDEEYHYVFAGWDTATETDGDVVYTAEYLAIPNDGTPAHEDPSNPTPSSDVTPPPSESTGDPTPTAPAVGSDVNSNVSTRNGLIQTGDGTDLFVPVLIAGVAIAALALVYTRRKLDQNR